MSDDLEKAVSFWDFGEPSLDEEKPKEEASIEYTKDQEGVLSALNGHGNVFVTGAAGTGKSFVFNNYFQSDECVRRYGGVPILASTGAAAILVGGRTFHSFFGLKNMQGPPHKIIEDALDSYFVCRGLSYTDCIAVDEISMLSAETLEVAEEIARTVRQDPRPWGGLRILASGAFLQLPPVSNAEQVATWAFQGSVWEASEFQTALLKEVVRSP